MDGVVCVLSYLVGSPGRLVNLGGVQRGDVIGLSCCRLTTTVTRPGTTCENWVNKSRRCLSRSFSSLVLLGGFCVSGRYDFWRTRTTIRSSLLPISVLSLCSSVVVCFQQSDFSSCKSNTE